MSDPSDLFTSFRPSDLRFDNVHLLAEYIAQAQRVVDSASRLQDESKSLLAGAVKTARRGVSDFSAAAEQLENEGNKFCSKLRATLHDSGGALVSALRGSLEEVGDAGADLIRQSGRAIAGPAERLAENADRLHAAAARLEAAAERANAARLAADHAQSELQSFLTKVQAFEVSTMARIAQARTQLYQGVGFWKRLTYVLCPPAPVVALASRPKRPGVNAEVNLTHFALGSPK